MLYKCRRKLLNVDLFPHEHDEHTPEGTIGIVHPSEGILLDFFHNGSTIIVLDGHYSYTMNVDVSLRKCRNIHTVPVTKTLFHIGKENEPMQSSMVMSPSL